ERLFADLLAAATPPADPPAPASDPAGDPAAPRSEPLPATERIQPHPRLRPLDERLLAAADPLDLVTTLLARANHAGAGPPAAGTPILPPPPRAERAPHTVPPPRAHGKEAKETRTRTTPRGDAAAPPSFVPFRINWGERQGADPRRLLALVCRRGGIRGS